MPATIDIGPGALLMMYALLLLPISLCRLLGIPILRDLATAVARMSIQLLLVGVYLEVIFRINNIMLNAGWILMMVVVADLHIIRSSGLRIRRFFLPLLLGVGGGTAAIALFFVLLVIQPRPLYDARYLIPITGMVLGNCLRANVICLDRFFSGLQQLEPAYINRLLMGATRHEALLPHLRDAIRAALAPTVATMATLGLVSLPGMMTGQILGGSVPLVAIKYQIGIMIAIFTATALTALLNIRLSIQAAFTSYHILDRTIFLRP